MSDSTEQLRPAPDSDIEMGERATGSTYQSKYQPVGYQQTTDSKHLRQRFKPWHEIKEPGKRYVTSETFLHQDGLGRIDRAPPTDCYLSPSSGKLRELVVQATGPIFATGPPTTWARTPSRKAAPWSARLSDMPYDPRKSGGERIFGYMGACLGLLFVLFVPIKDPEIRYGGNYAPFPYTVRRLYIPMLAASKAHHYFSTVWRIPEKCEKCVRRPGQGSALANRQSQSR